MAPLNRLGDEFALGAWVVDGDPTRPSSRSARRSTRMRPPRSSAHCSSAGRSASTPQTSGRATSRRLHCVAGVAERVRRARLKSGCPSKGRGVRVPPPALAETLATRAGRVDRPTKERDPIVGPGLIARHRAVFESSGGARVFLHALRFQRSNFATFNIDERSRSLKSGFTSWSKLGAGLRRRRS